MIVFAITMLVIILCVLQHLLNYLWRIIDISVEGEATGAIITTLVVGIISYFIVFHILKWGCLIDLN